MLHPVDSCLQDFKCFATRMRNKHWCDLYVFQMNRFHNSISDPLRPFNRFPSNNKHDVACSHCITGLKPDDFLLMFFSILGQFCFAQPRCFKRFLSVPATTWTIQKHQKALGKDLGRRTLVKKARLTHISNSVQENLLKLRHFLSVR